jgi:membrane protein implicated in regulation of membrane protease activity
VFLLLALLLFLVLPYPWSLAAALVSLILFAIEVLFWERRVRRRKVTTGVENLVGASGVVTGELAPVGTIRVLGELWEARANEKLPVGTRVRVTAVHDLTLEVEPANDHSLLGGARLGPAAVLLVLALAGCGGDDSSASEDYANDVCSSLSTWVTDVQETVQSLTDAGLAITRQDIQTAFDDAKESTDTLVSDLEQLGPPETEDGEQAKSELDELGTELRQQLDAVEQALASGGGATAIAAEVTTAISAAANAVNTTYQDLQNLDPAGELRDAFEDSDDCNSLGDQLEDIRPQS